MRSSDRASAAESLAESLLDVEMLEYPESDIIRSDEHLGYLAGAIDEIDNALYTAPTRDQESELHERELEIRALARERIQQIIDEEDLDVALSGRGDRIEERIEELSGAGLLSERQAEAHALRERGWRAQEIADRMEISTSTVYSTVDRAEELIESARETVDLADS